MKATLDGKRYSIKRCPACRGTGVVTGIFSLGNECRRQTCSNCGGKGSIVRVLATETHAMK